MVQFILRFLFQRKVLFQRKDFRTVHNGAKIKLKQYSTNTLVFNYAKLKILQSFIVYYK